MFVYLSGSEKGKTRIFSQNHVTIGTSDTCDLKLVPEDGGAFPDRVLADVFDDDGAFNLVPRPDTDHLAVSVNGDELAAEQAPAGHPLNDGDRLHFGRGLSSASVLFQVMPDNFSAAHLVRRTNNEIEKNAARPVHPLTATLFVKELTASLWAEIPRRAKLGALATVLLLAGVIGGILYLGFSILNRTTTDSEAIKAQIEAIQSQTQHDKHLISKQQEELDKLRKESEQTQLFTQRIIELYSPGVCLLVGSYTFVERGTGRPLRYESSDDANETPVDQDGNLLASVDGAGPPVEINYTGTGFVVERGMMATNKHVVQPWAGDQIAQIIMQQGGGFRPRLNSLKAFFPTMQIAFEVRVAKTSDRYDVALCRFEQGTAALPVLPLSMGDPKSIIGQPVVLLGFPTGLDGLLQRIDESERTEVQREFGQSYDDIATGLARRALIRPLTTTGTIGDALPGRIAHSAQTAEGGSGSPMFDREGQVIAINSAILTTLDGTQSFGGSNFGVPIKIAYEMIASYQASEAKP
ncbi:MAG TPA: trypsin-like peptidase domain-containing protein [Blastocatellia bacterium]|nr:trypsin-like peptidase domain-containing protein [Blastocatellia bacterium]